MKIKIKTAVASLLSLALSLTPLLSTQLAQAATYSAALYLSPASATIQENHTLTVNVYVDSGSTQINYVQANLSYSTAKLAYESYTNSSAFPLEASNPSGNTGTLKFGRGSFSPVTGKQLVVTVVFKAVANNTTTSISFCSGTLVGRYCPGCDPKDPTIKITPTTTGGSYTLGSSTTSGSGGSGSGGSSSSSGSSNTNPTTAKDTTPPKITNITISDITSSNATIIWKTNEPATSVVSYGLNAKNLLEATDTRLTTEHKITLPLGILDPDTSYIFTVSGKDKAGNKATSKQHSFKTREASQASPQPAANQPAAKKSSSGNGLIVFGAILVAIATVGTILYRFRNHSIDLNTPTSNNPTTSPPQTTQPSKIVPPSKNMDDRR